jgi:hypothetical protein
VFHLKPPGPTGNAAQRSMIADAALVFLRSDTEIPAGIR